MTSLMTFWNFVMLSFSRFSLPLAGALSLATLSPALVARTAQAQSRLPACPAPAAQEYLLLVRGETEAERRKIASVLPADNTVLVCEYLDEVLVRAGGFTSLETANAWATYMTTVEGYESFVSRPQADQVANSGSTNGATGSATAGTGDFRPLRLSVGYAVLVDYGDRPEIANAVSQVVRPVGLAVYQGRAYLLAEYTRDPDSAAATLQRLSDAQTTAILVDAQQVVRLTPAVARF